MQYKNTLIIFLLLVLLVVIYFMQTNKQENMNELPNTKNSIQQISTLYSNIANPFTVNNLNVTGKSNLNGDVNVSNNLQLSNPTNTGTTLSLDGGNLNYSITTNKSGLTLSNVNQNNNTTTLMSIDTSGNINIPNTNIINASGIQLNASGLQLNVPDGLTINGPIKSILPNSTDTTGHGFRVWNQSVWSRDLLTDGVLPNFPSNQWTVICGGAQFTGGDATGVFTYIYNGLWYAGASAGYTGTFIAIPNTFIDGEKVNVNVVSNNLM
jgi:hypothetical protein